MNARPRSTFACVLKLSRNPKMIPNGPRTGHVSQTHEEGRLIGDDGLLRIDWPRLVAGGAPVSLELLLVAANDARITINSVVRADSCRHRRTLAVRLLHPQLRLSPRFPENFWKPNWQPKPCRFCELPSPVATRAPLASAVL
jgi:hypothetical protein